MTLTDRRILITGATDGIGFQTAKRLAKQNAIVILHGRSQERLQKASEALSEGFRCLQADLSSLAEVRQLVDKLLDTDPLDVLINNAGVGFGPPGGARELSRDGYELRWAVNFLAPFALTEWLLAARHAPRAVVNVASVGQANFDFSNLMLEHSYDGTQAYRQSKLALIAWSFDFAARNPAIATNALHPGSLLNTKIVQESFGYSLGDPETGAKAIEYVAQRALEDGVRGRYFDVQAEAQAKPLAYDKQAQARLRRHAIEAVAPFGRDLTIAD